MTDTDDQINWVSLEIEIPDDLGAHIEKLAQEAGVTLQCFCAQAVMDYLLRTVPPEEKQHWEKHVEATLRRNGCPPKQPPQES